MPIKDPTRYPQGARDGRFAPMSSLYLRKFHSDGDCTLYHADNKHGQTLGTIGYWPTRGGAWGAEANTCPRRISELFDTREEAAHWLLRTMDGQTDGWRKHDGYKRWAPHEAVECGLGPMPNLPTNRGRRPERGRDEEQSTTRG